MLDAMLPRLLRDHLRPYTGAVATVVALQLVGTLASLYLPSLNADIIDNGVARGNTGYILRTGGWMLAVALLQVLCTIAAVYVGARTAMAFGRDVRARVFAHVTRFSARELAQFGAPTLITRAPNAVQQVQMLVLGSAPGLIAAPIMAIGGVVMALRQDVGLSWLMAISVPVLLAVVGLIVSRMVPLFQAMQARLDDVNRVLREQLAGIRVIRAFVREPTEVARFAAANAALTDTMLRAGRLMVAIFPTVMLVLNVSSVAVLWFGAGRIQAGQMQIGALTAFLTYLLQILMSVMMATIVVIMIPRASVAAGRIGDVLASTPTLVAPAHPVTGQPRPGYVELRAAAFQYPGAAAPVLADISLQAIPGTTTAIIGATGSGKTTLLSLVPRLFDVTAGQVLVGGVDVRELDPHLLRAQLGWVPQQAYLFSGTVASNLRYGKADASDDELWAALEVAQARDFVAALPDGLQAPVRQGGVNFSGGQRQRLSIARALVRRPQVYLFDDAFSALDVATDARLRTAMGPIVRDATILVVAQRVSTIRDADQILVLDQGRSVAAGRHDELVAASPAYAEIGASQHAQMMA
jgi:ATP-binding cassette subfamily B protein